MKKLFALAAALAAVIFMICFGLSLKTDNEAYVFTDADRNLIRDAVNEQMKKYPESRLQDLYKNFFQDFFGPGHLIENSGAADEYLRSELASYSESFGPDAEKTGWRGNFYRVNLSVIKDNKVPYKKFFDAFIESAASAESPSLSRWTAEWNEIMRIIDSMRLDLPGYETDKKKIDSLLASGSYMMHHSEAYRKHYRPHYRVISRSVFPNLKIKESN